MAALTGLLNTQSALEHQKLGPFVQMLYGAGDEEKLLNEDYAESFLCV